MSAFRNINRILLASGSPRRRQLIEYLGLPVEIIVSGADESCPPGDPGQAARELAIRKAAAAAQLRAPGPGEVLVSADTSVWIDGTILGKPASEEDAFRMLRMLSGRVHQVYTGTAIMYLSSDTGGGAETAGASGSGDTVCCMRAFDTGSEVCFGELSDADIREYIATGEPMDKAGSYGIQGAFSVHAEWIKGEYNNIVGLPVAALRRQLILADPFVLSSPL